MDWMGQDEQDENLFVEIEDRQKGLGLLLKKRSC